MAVRAVERDFTVVINKQCAIPFLAVAMRIYPRAVLKLIKGACAAFLFAVLDAVLVKPRNQIKRGVIALILRPAVGGYLWLFLWQQVGYLLE